MGRDLPIPISRLPVLGLLALAAADAGRAAEAPLLEDDFDGIRLDSTRWMTIPGRGVPEVRDGCSLPDEAGGCAGDPALQKYRRVPSWDALRARPALWIALAWTPSAVGLRMTDGAALSGEVVSRGDAIPDAPLREGRSPRLRHLHRADPRRHPKGSPGVGSRPQSAVP